MLMRSMLIPHGDRRFASEVRFQVEQFGFPARLSVFLIGETLLISGAS